MELPDVIEILVFESGEWSISNPYEYSFATSLYKTVMKSVGCNDDVTDLFYGLYILDGPNSPHVEKFK